MSGLVKQVKQSVPLKVAIITGYGPSFKESKIIWAHKGGWTIFPIFIQLIILTNAIFLDKIDVTLAKPKRRRIELRNQVMSIEIGRNGTIMIMCVLVYLWFWLYPWPSSYHQVWHCMSWHCHLMENLLSFSH